MGIMNQYKKQLIKLCISSLCLALCLLLPFVTGQIPKVGNMLCPMHIPVLLCGFLCGAPYGLAIGAVAPLLRNLIFGMPQMIPAGLSMSFELAAYGLLVAFCYRSFPKKKRYLYVSLLLAMLGGRLVWGIVRFVIGQVTGLPFTLALFISGGFTTAIPGIVLQLVLIPPVVITLKKARLVPER